ncbi:MAG: hypothetical protein JJU05_14270 [Verrucomicrobia bacterium]|nr:hypothetical protein [Verrucomicrobiota bacterium]MCH8526603.1 hypothetical protein [Kiritimatiellia bacterium]
MKTFVHIFNRKWLIGVLIFLGVGAVSLLLPIWDAPPFESGSVLHERVEVHPGDTVFWEKLDTLLEKYEAIRYRDAVKWEAEPETYREAINDWLEQTNGLEEELLGLLDTYSVIYSPLTPGEGYVADEAIRALEIGRVLYQRLRHHMDVDSAMNTYDVLYRYVVDMQVPRPNSMMTVLAARALTDYYLHAGIILLHLFPENLPVDFLKNLEKGAMGCSSLNPEYWVEGMDMEFLYFKDILPSAFSDIELLCSDFLGWLPRWNSFFYQPNRTLALQEEVLKMNRSLFLETLEDSSWGSLDEIRAYSTALDDCGLKRVHNYYGRILVTIFFIDYHPGYLRGVSLNRMSQTLAALHRYRRVNGRLPGELADLVPDFIKSVPMDPFDGRPIRYDAERGIVYSVNENGEDNGGDSTGGRIPERGLDYVIRIDGEG